MPDDLRDLDRLALPVVHVAHAGRDLRRVDALEAVGAGHHPRAGQQAAPAPGRVEVDGERVPALMGVAAPDDLVEGAAAVGQLHGLVCWVVLLVGERDFNILLVRDCVIPVLLVRDCVIPVLMVRDYDIPVLLVRDCVIPVLMVRDYDIPILLVLGLCRSSTRQQDEKSLEGEKCTAEET